MRQRIAVYGAGGHARVVLDAIAARGDADIWGIAVDDPSMWGQEWCGVAVRGSMGHLIECMQQYDAVIVAIGSNADRIRIAHNLAGEQIPLCNVIHPSAIVSPSARIGSGTAIMAGAIVQPDAWIDGNVIINTGASADHDCVVGDSAHLAPGARLAGNVTIGSGSFIGMGTLVLPGRSVGDWAVTGAGSVVITDIPDRVVAYGVPARVRRSLAPSCIG